VVSRHPVHVPSRRAYPPEKIAPANHKSNLHPAPRHFRYFGRQPVETLLVDTKTVSTGQNLAAQLQ
jgi:hypothetical protein